MAIGKGLLGKDSVQVLAKAAVRKRIVNAWVEPDMAQIDREGAYSTRLCHQDDDTWKIFDPDDER